CHAFQGDEAMRTRIAASIVAVLLLVAFGWAQSNRGDITGTVKDVSGGALPGVRVALPGPAQRVVTTNGRGEFAFRNLPPGPYETRFELAGFATVVSKVNLQG